MSVNVGQATGYLDIDISGFVKNLQAADAEVRKQTQTIGNTLGSGLQTVGNKMTSSGKVLTASVTAPILGIGAASIKTAGTFEKGMSQVQATMGITKNSMSTLDGQSVNTMDALGKLAQNMGSTTKFSAVEAADAINILAMAGYDTEKIYKSLPNILNLAAAGDLDIANAADIATGVMAGFNMKAEDSAMVSDKIATMASSAKGSVSDFGTAMATAAGQASVTGQSFDDTAVALEILGNHNLSAAEGGNALNRVLKNLYQPTDSAKKALAELGVSAYDAEGKAKPLPQVLQELKDKTSTLSSAEYNDIMGQIFDAATMKSVPFLINDCTDAWDKQDDSVTSLIEGIEGASEAYDGIGAASGQAQAQLDNLDGQITLLKSAIEGISIQLGNILMPYVKEFVKRIQELANWFTNLSTEQQKHIVKLALMAAAIGPVLLVLGKMVTGIATLITSFKTISTTISNIKSGFSLLQGAIGGVSLPIIAVVAAIGILVAAFLTLWNTNEDFRNKVTAIWEEVKETFGGFVKAISERMGLIKQAFGNIIKFIEPLWKGFCNMLAPVFVAAFKIISATLKTILGVIIGLLDIFIGVFTGDWKRALNGIKSVFSSIWNGIVAILTTILSTLWNMIKNKLVSIKSVISGTLNAIKSVFSSIWNGISSVVSSAINGISKTISNGIQSAKNTISKILDSIKDKFKSIWDGVTSIVSKAINKIKGFFNFKWSLPHIDLPHFSISGSFGLNPPSIPTFNVDWYKKAMRNGIIMNEPTIFGWDSKTGRFLAGGESGSETIVGTMSLLDMIKQTVYSAMVDAMNAVKSLFIGDVFGSTNSSSMLGFNYDALAQALYNLLANAPIVNNIDLNIEDGDVNLDGERVGRKLAPIISRIIATS